MKMLKLCTYKANWLQSPQKIYENLQKNINILCPMPLKCDGQHNIIVLALMWHWCIFKKFSPLTRELSLMSWVPPTLCLSFSLLVVLLSSPDLYVLPLRTPWTPTSHKCVIVSRYWISVFLSHIYSRSLLVTEGYVPNIIAINPYILWFMCPTPKGPDRGALQISRSFCDQKFVLVWRHVSHIKHYDWPIVLELMDSHPLKSQCI